MSKNLIKRKLSAILSADAKDYSRLMRMDEEATVRTLTRYRSLIAGLVSNYHGRVVDSPGDNVLAEFASVVHAVQCAFDIQASLKDENAELSEDRRMEFRIGINLGDVIQEKERLYGDGVNVAARMESLAEPGGICVSGSAYDQIEHKFAFGCEYLGEQTVKNISTPIRAYRLTRDETGAGCTVGAQYQKSPNRILIAVVLGLLILSAGAFLTWTLYRNQAAAPLGSTAEDQTAQPLPDRPSIAVLPFKNLSGDEKDGLIAKGLTEDIITALSRVPDLFVIASASSLAYEGKPVKIKQVSKDLGVRYVLDGSLQHSKDRLRLNVQLADAIAGNQIWADRFDRPLGDLFVLQDELVRRILVELQVRLTAGEFARIASRKTQNLDAWLLFGQGFHEGFKYTRESMVRARELFESARKKDPDWARPLVGLSWVYWNETRYEWTDDPEEWMRKGFELAGKAVELEPEEPGGYQKLAMLNLSWGDYDSAIAFREKALKLAPNDFVVVWGLGYVLYNAGDAQRGVDFLKKAERMSPHPPVLLLWAIAEAQLLAGQYENAIETSKRAVALKSDRVIPHIILTAANTALGRSEEAQTQAAEVLKKNPKFTVSAWMKSRLLKNPEDEERYTNLLLAAGLPEKPK
jgi:adenylate cyclase